KATVARIRRAHPGAGTRDSERTEAGRTRSGRSPDEVTGGPEARARSRSETAGGAAWPSERCAQSHPSRVTSPSQRCSISCRRTRGRARTAHSAQIQTRWTGHGTEPATAWTSTVARPSVTVPGRRRPEANQKRTGEGGTLRNIGTKKPSVNVSGHPFRALEGAPPVFGWGSGASAFCRSRLVARAVHDHGGDTGERRQIQRPDRSRGCRGDAGGAFRQTRGHGGEPAGVRGV